MSEELTNPKIAIEINDATRPTHDELQELIEPNMDQILPPGVETPEKFSYGLLAMAEIYFIFESAAATLTPTEFPNVRHELLDFLIRCVPESLLRTEQLRKDIDHLTRFRSLTLDEVWASKLPETALTLREWRSGFEDRFEERPHIILAYYWTMYMAIFRGGKITRLKLSKAGTAFWEGTYKHEEDIKPKAPLDQPGFSFLSFSECGEVDGSNIVREFRKLVAEGEHILTTQEAEEVVAEARIVFAVLVDVIRGLDQELRKV